MTDAELATLGRAAAAWDEHLTADRRYWRNPVRIGREFRRYLQGHGFAVVSAAQREAVPTPDVTARAAKLFGAPQ